MAKRKTTRTKRAAETIEAVIARREHRERVLVKEFIQGLVLGIVLGFLGAWMAFG